MKSYKQLITEISRLDQYSFTGGKKTLSSDFKLRVPEIKKTDVKKLPGGSGFYYAVYKSKYRGTNLIDIAIVDYDDGEQIIAGALSLKEYYTDVKALKGYRVDAITTNEDYRGKGLALSLYGIALSILKIQLISGSSQTPGGRAMWMKLNDIPGVEVKGVFELYGHDKKGWKNTDLDAVMQLGGEYLGSTKDKYGHFFAFDVVALPDKVELAPYIKNNKSVIYNNDAFLIAKWVG